MSPDSAKKREVARQRSRDWYYANKDRAKKNAKAYQKANRKRYAVLAAKYRLQNPEKHREIKRRHNETHKARIAELAARRRLANVEVERERSRRSSAIDAKRHPDRVRANNANARARKRGAPGKHTAADIVDLVKLQKGRCAHSWCKVKFGNKFHRDHIIPLARGGSNDRSNIQLLCQPCNNKKKDYHPVDFAQKNGMLL